MTKPPPTTESTPPWAAELSLRERRFVEEYVIDLNGRQAAIRAGLGRNPKSAGEMAARMRKKPHVAAAISALMTECSGVTGAAVVNELGAIAFSRITDYLKLENGRLVLTVADLNSLSDESKAAIAKLRERVNDDGSISIEVELHDKIAALDRLGKATRLFVNRQEVSGPNGDPIEYKETVEDVRSRIRARLERLAKGYGAVEVDPPVRQIAPPTQPAAPIIDAE